MPLRPFDPHDATDSENAERTAAELRTLVDRLDRSRVTIGKLVSGQAGHLPLARDIEIAVGRGDARWTAG
jgi:hypothetical protein